MSKTPWCEKHFLECKNISKHSNLIQVSWLDKTLVCQGILILIFTLINDYIAVASRAESFKTGFLQLYLIAPPLPCHQRWRYLQIVPQHNIDWADFTTGAVPWDLAGYFLHCHEWGITKELLSLSGDLGIGLVWDNHPHRSFLVWLLKSSSNWTKLSMMGPQLFSG